MKLSRTILLRHADTFEKIEFGITAEILRQFAAETDVRMSANEAPLIVGSYTRASDSSPDTISFNMEYANGMCWNPLISEHFERFFYTTFESGLIYIPMTNIFHRVYVNYPKNIFHDEHNHYAGFLLGVRTETWYANKDGNHI
jgi:hypothetical protein